MNTKTTGDASTSFVLAHLLRLGKHVSIPFGDRSRYDLVIDEEGVFVRVQVKTGWLRKGVVMANACSTGTGKYARRQSYLTQADLIAVVCLELDKIYWLKPHETPLTPSLRVTAPRNSQLNKIRWAKDFEEYKPPISPPSDERLKG